MVHKGNRGRRLTVTLNRNTFQNMVNGIVRDVYGTSLSGGTRYRFQSQSLLKLQEGAESFLENMLEQVQDIAAHAGRENVLPRDVMLWKRTTDFKIRHIRSNVSLCSMFESLPLKRKYSKM